MPRTLTAPKQSHRIPNAEIFSTGTFDGTDYDEAWLDKVVENYQRLASGDEGFRLDPPARKIPTIPDTGIGHEDDQEYLRKLMERTDHPAAGWPKNIRRVGEFLYADIEDVPHEIKNEIDTGKLRKFSAEFYPDYQDPMPPMDQYEPVLRPVHEYPFTDEQGTVHYGPALRRVSYLGGELPKNRRIADIPKPIATYAERLMRVRSTLLYFSEVSPGANTMSPEMMEKLSQALMDLGLTEEQIQGVMAAMQADADGGTAAGAISAPMPFAGSDEIRGKNQDAQKRAMWAKDPEPPHTQHAESVSGGEVINAPDVVDPGEPGKAPAMSGVAGKYISDPGSAATNINIYAERALQKMLAPYLPVLRQMQANNAAAKRTRIQTFAEQMVKEGRVYPHEMNSRGADGKPQPTLVDRLMALDDVNKLLTFGESKVSPLEAEMESIRRRPVLRKFSESMAQPLNGGAPAGKLDPAEREAIHSRTPHGREILRREAKAREAGAAKGRN